MNLFLQIFANAMTEVFLWYVQKFVVISWAGMQFQSNRFSIKFEMGPWLRYVYLSNTGTSIKATYRDMDA